jgi:hypothetical protein
MTPPGDASDGHALAGRFAPATRVGSDRPLASRAAKPHGTLFDAESDEDLAPIAQALVREARVGDFTAACELLDRLLSKPVELELIERLDALELSLQEARRG